MILIALGANLSGPFGEPEMSLEKAMMRLECSGVRILARSSIWVTEPVPASDQPLYRNAVIAVETDLKPEALLTLLHAIEAEFGRIRHERNEARVIDLDLLAYNNEIISTEDFYLPHPRMQDRAFVLVPLCEINGGWLHPVSQKTARELLDAIVDRENIAAMKVAA